MNAFRRVGVGSMGANVYVLGRKWTSTRCEGRSDSMVLYHCVELSVRKLHEAQIGWIGEPAPYLVCI